MDCVIRGQKSPQCGFSFSKTGQYEIPICYGLRSRESNGFHNEKVSEYNILFI